MTSTLEVLENLKCKRVNSMEGNVLTHFRARNVHLDKQKKGVPSALRASKTLADCAEDVAEVTIKDKENSRPKADVSGGARNYVERERPVENSDTVPFPVFEDSEDGEFTLPSAPKFSPEAEDFVPATPPSATAEISQGNVSPQNEVQGENTLDAAKAQLAGKVASLSSSSKGSGSPTIVVTCSTDSDAEADEEEDREHMKTFSLWGTPDVREKPRFRVRKVVLTGLPVGSDLTLVQSLVSGGAIENFLLSPTGSTSYVTFTSADACDCFYDKYPNGITFKYKGKTHTVFVDKAKDVDVISGILQGWLDCGASRCVRAVGADSDWGMGALHKLAFGKSRKLENITDVLRNDIRTIVFRFASIADAVQFKGS